MNKITRRLAFTALACLTLLGMTTHKMPVLAKPAVVKPYRPSVYLNLDLVRKIVCLDPNDATKGVGVGTAEIVGKGIMITAAHVVAAGDLPQCYDAATKAPVRPYLIDPEADFAMLAFDDGSSGEMEYMRYSCEGFVNKARYQAIGYALGQALILNRMTATDRQTSRTYTLSSHRVASGLQYLNGDIFQGMSGGPIINEDGVIIGINSATDHRGIGLSRALKDTALCRHD
jgi:S1-C subfamily serine protease